MNKLKRYKTESRVVQHQDEIVQFFLKNPDARDSEVHLWAKQLGMTPEALEGEIYHLLSCLLKGVGKHAHMPDMAFDPQQLEMGIKVETEHTDNPAVAKIIAKDHLVEFPDYYTRLLNMEDQAKEDETVGLEIAVAKRLEVSKNQNFTGSVERLQERIKETEERLKDKKGKLAELTKNDRSPAVTNKRKKLQYFIRKAQTQLNGLKKALTQAKKKSR